MHRHNMYNTYGSKCVIPVAAFALGAIVGVIGSEKIRFFHKMHMELHKKYGFNCCKDNESYNPFSSAEEKEPEPQNTQNQESSETV